MSDLVLDASLALQWFLEDEADRKIQPQRPLKPFRKASHRSSIVVL